MAILQKGNNKKIEKIFGVLTVKQRLGTSRGVSKAERVLGVRFHKTDGCKAMKMLGGEAMKGAPLMV